MPNLNEENPKSESPENNTELSTAENRSENPSDKQETKTIQEPIKDIFENNQPQDKTTPPPSSSRVNTLKSRFNSLLMTMQPEEDFEDDGKIDAEMRAESKQRWKENNVLHNINIPRPVLSPLSAKTENNSNNLNDSHHSNQSDIKTHKPKKQKPVPSEISEKINSVPQEHQQELPEYDIFTDNDKMQKSEETSSDVRPVGENPKEAIFAEAANVHKNKQGRKKKKKNKNRIAAQRSESIQNTVTESTVSKPKEPDNIKSEPPKMEEPKAESEKTQEEKNSETKPTADIKDTADTIDNKDNSDNLDNTIFRRSDTSNTEKNKNKTDELKMDDDIKIIPWNHQKQHQQNQPEPAKNEIDSKDFSEGHMGGVIYHQSTSQPFVVMAGKFTKTLRSEYEYLRIYHKALAEKQEEESAQNTVNNKTNPAEKTVQTAKTNRRPPVRQKSPSLPDVPRKRQRTEPVKADRPENTETVVKQPKTQKVQDIQNIPNQKPQMPEMRRKKLKLPSFSLKDMLSDEEEFDPEDTTIEEQIERPLLDDYNEEKDADEIKYEIENNFRVVFLRTSILFLALIASVIIAVLAQCTPLFKSSRNGWLVYAILSFIVFSVSVIASRLPIVNGLMPLKHLKGNADTAVAVASFAAAIQSITAIFTPKLFVNGTLHIYVPLVILALFLNNFGRLLITLRASENFRFLIKPFPKYAGKIYTDIRTAEKMVSEFPNKKPIIGYTKRSKFMSNFLQLSYVPDPSEVLASRAAPVTTGISIVAGIICGILKRDFAAGVSSFALTACISTPILCLLSINIPLLRLCRNALRGGAMVTSYETVQQFCDTNAILLESSQLYPKGTITLSGMKAFKQSKLNDAITAGAAVMYAVNGPMCGVFDNIVQCSKSMLPRVDSVVYEDNKGLVGWVGGQRILIGNRDLLESHNVKAPDLSLEERYRDDFNEISYITVGGELIAMFVLAYKPDREIIHELRNLEENGVSFVIRTVDPNVTKESVAKKFYLYHRCITILPTGLGTICHNAMSSVDDRSRAYLVTRGKISSFARAVAGCIRIKSNVTISKILQYVSIVIGLVLVTGISFISGFEKLGNIEMLIYMGFWALASVAVSMIKK